MSTPEGREYPPADWDADGIAAALREAGTPRSAPLPSYGEEAVWTALRGDDLTGPVVEELLERADDARGEPVPEPPATRYLEVERTGDRRGYEEPDSTRQRRLALFAVAECVEREGRYLDPVLDYAWSICEQSTWVWPAHLAGPEGVDPREYREGLPVPVPPEHREVGIISVGTALLLASVDHLLGDRLHPALRERVRHEADERLFSPYLARDDFRWQSSTDNWNAVCNGGAVGTALYLLEDADRAARVIEQAAAAMGHYLDGFGPDGCTPEGVGYWSYGFGSYVRAAEHLEAATGGAHSLVSPPIVDAIARFPLGVELSPGRYLPFSDAEETAGVPPAVLCWLGRRLDVPALAARGRAAFEADPWYSTPVDVLWHALRVREVGADAEAATPPLRQFFEGCAWWLARADPADPDGLVVAAKGGHNGEHHNHNDCGTVVVHHRGESLLTDLGAPTYDRDYFGDGRYENLAARSLGHSVPLVDGHEQAAGAEYAARVVDRESGPDGDALALDLADCYPAAGLESLRRTVALERDAGTVTVADRAAFADVDASTDAADGTPALESVLVSYHPMEAAGERVVVTGDAGRATVVAAGPVAASVEHLPDAVDDRDVWRARFAPRDGAGEREAAVELTVEVGAEGE